MSQKEKEKNQQKENTMHNYQGGANLFVGNLLITTLDIVFSVTYYLE